MELEIVAGVPVVMDVQNDVGIVSMHADYSVGSSDERSGEGGAAHLAEHLFASQTPGSRAHSEELHRLGAIDIGATSGWDHSRFTFTIESSQFPSTVEIELCRLLGRDFSLEQFTREHAVVLREIDRESTRDHAQNWFSAYCSIAYPENHHYRRPPAGTLEDVSGLSFATLRRFVDREYRLERLRLTFVGEFDKKTLLKGLKSTIDRISLESYSRQPDLESSYHLNSRAGLVRGISHSWNAPNGPERACVGFHISSFNNRDYLIAQLVACILGSGRDSRISRSVGLADTFHDGNHAIAWEFSRCTSLLTLTAASQSQSARSIATKLLELAGTIETEPPTDREIMRAAGALRGHWLRQISSTSSRADAIGTFASLGRQPEEVDLVADRWLTITTDDCVRFAKTYLTRGSENSLLYSIHAGELSL